MRYQKNTFRYILFVILILAVLSVCLNACAGNPGTPGSSTAAEGISTQDAGTSSALTDPGTPAATERTQEPVSTQTPGTGTNPETTTGGPAGTTAVSAASSVPETTAVPGSSDVPPRTAAPETTKEITTAAPTTQSPEDTTAPDGSFTFTLSFAGDTQLADNYNNEKKAFAASWAVNDPSFYLAKVNPVFEKDDFTLLNLECVLTDRDLERVKKDESHYRQYWYKGPTEYIQAITCASVEGLSVANNHYGDYGTEGREDTVNCVRSAGLLCGTYENTIYVKKNGYTVAIICDGLWNLSQEGSIINRVKAASKKSDFQIVFWHGGTEYRHAPLEWQMQASHDIVDAGADLVIGNHAHVLQPIETYKGVRIVYSLGNFCYGGMSGENATVIYQAVLTIDKDNHLISAGENVIPCYVYTKYPSNFQPAPMTGASAIKKVIDFMNGDLTDLEAANKRKPV